MIALLEYNGQQYRVDFQLPIDLSLPLLPDGQSVDAFSIDQLRYEAIRVGSFVGSVQEGGSCNCENILFNPHGNGTHTECVGHITRERITVNQCLKEFVFMARLMSISPTDTSEGDRVISCEAVEAAIEHPLPEALIIRTLPNSPEKRTAHYSGTNPPYIQARAADFIRSCGVRHLLIDLPSMDKENDGGMLLAHRAFWNYPSTDRYDCTITEMVYIPDEVQDGLYLLQLQIASFESDASPSKPVIYRLLP